MNISAAAKYFVRSSFCRILLLMTIGVGRFRILGGGGGGEGGQGLEYWGAKGGQIPSKHMTS